MSLSRLGRPKKCSEPPSPKDLRVLNIGFASGGNIVIGDLDGIPAFTITVAAIPALNLASEPYLNVVADGLSEIWELGAEETATYLAALTGSEGNDGRGRHQADQPGNDKRGLIAAGPLEQQSGQPWSGQSGRAPRGEDPTVEPG